MKKRVKYSTGTAVKGYIEDPSDKLAQNQIDIAEAMYRANTNPLTIGLQAAGNLTMQAGMMGGGFTGVGGLNPGQSNTINSILPTLANLPFPYGGKVPVEVEGGEVMEDPSGRVAAFQGPQHKDGGIDLNLEPGTEIFSDRIKIEGESMAERKIKRERKESRLQNKLEKYPYDNIIQSTLSRVATDNKDQEQKDMHIQELVRALTGQKTSYETGGVIEPDEWLKKFNIPYSHQDLVANGLWDSKYGQEYKKYAQGITGYDPVKGPVTAPSSLPPLSSPSPQAKGNYIPQPSQAGQRDLLSYFPESNLTGGDAVSFAGKAFSSIAPLFNTLANRAGDRPNVNPYKFFGERGLQTLDSSGQYIGQQRDKALDDLELSRNSLISRNRNSARSINTLRALDLVSDQSVNKARGDIYSNYAQQMMALLGQKAGFQNQQDQVVMGGEGQKDIANRQDRDNFYTQRGRDFATLGEGVQHIGKDINAVRERTVIENLLNQLSAYGLKLDKDGNLVKG